MPPFRLQPAELNGLVAFIRSGFDISATPFKVGDAGRGKAVYDGKGACAACHRVAGKGARTAPDLSEVGAIRQPAAIQRSLLDPSRAMVPINRPLRIVTRDGRTIRGRRVNEDTATVQLIDEGGTPRLAFEIRYPRIRAWHHFQHAVLRRHADRRRISGSARLSSFVEGTVMRISLRYVLLLLGAFGLSAPVASQAQVTPERIERAAAEPQIGSPIMAAMTASASARSTRSRPAM